MRGEKGGGRGKERMQIQNLPEKKEKKKKEKGKKKLPPNVVILCFVFARKPRFFFLS
jgi:hypothetical protein